MICAPGGRLRGVERSSHSPDLLQLLGGGGDSIRLLEAIFRPLGGTELDDASAV